MVDFDPDILRNRIKQLRQERGVTQKQFSAAIGSSTISNIRGWESGARTPSVYFLFQIANSCEVSADWLLGLTDERR